MSKFINIFNQLIIQNLKQLNAFFINNGPKILFALLVFIMGWFCAVLLKKIITKLLKALGFDIVSEKIGLKTFFTKGGIKSNPSRIVGLFFYWFILFSTLITIFNTLEIEGASKLIQQIIAYIPKFILAMILLSLGIFLGRFFGEFVEKAANVAKLPFALFIAKITQYAIIGLSLGFSLECLGVNIAIEYTFIFLTVAAFLICLIFMTGGRDVIANLLAGRLLTRVLKKGDYIELESISGQINAINLFTTIITSNELDLVIPNSELSRKIIKKRKNKS